MKSKLTAVFVTSMVLPTVCFFVGGHSSSSRVLAQAAAQTWVQLSPSGPLPGHRAGSAATYDPVNNVMTVFGGTHGSNGAQLNDVWFLINANGIGGSPVWTQLNPTGGPIAGRYAPSGVYDPGTNRMTVFGGDANGGFCFGAVNDVWVLSGANGVGTPAWAQLSPTGPSPGARRQHSAVYDAGTNRMIVFGGDQTCLSPYNDVWVLSNANGSGTSAWSQLAPAGGPVPGRQAHSAVYDGANNRMIVFGGFTGNILANDVWVLSDANGTGTPTWTQLSPSGVPPSARSEHTAIYDPGTNRMTVFGGNGSTGLLNDVWVLSNANGLGGVPAWTQLNPVDGPPSVRGLHNAIYDAATDRMTVFGGNCNGSSPACTPGNPFNFHLNDTWVLTGNGITSVAIDIKPGSFPNSINLGSGGNVPVAILSTASFDATTVDPLTVTLAGATVALKGRGTPIASFQDVNGDSILDLVVHVSTVALQLSVEDTTAVLEAQSVGGTRIRGTDSIRIVP